MLYREGLLLEIAHFEEGVNGQKDKALLVRFKGSTELKDLVCPV